MNQPEVQLRGEGDALVGQRQAILDGFLRADQLFGDVLASGAVVKLAAAIEAKDRGLPPASLR
ncbi:MAG: hypothetical protein ACYDAG_03205 [Chloroflexota bacterium]